MDETTKWVLALIISSVFATVGALGLLILRGMQKTLDKLCAEMDVITERLVRLEERAVAAVEHTRETGGIIQQQLSRLAALYQGLMGKSRFSDVGEDN